MKKFKCYKNLQYAILPLFIIAILTTGCNDDNNLECLSTEELASTDCPAEDVLLICEPFFCGAEFPPEGDQPGLAVDFLFPPPPFVESNACEVIDCYTLQCGDSAIYEDLEVNEFGLPSGLITDINGQQAPFFCQERL